MCDAVLTCHEEEKSLCHGFSMNESALSLKLGLRGMPGAAEDVMIARDIELARLTGARVHFCHVTTARAVTLIRRAKEDGIPVTAEVSPHHFTLTESAVDGYNTNAKMSPPLRTEEDRAAVLEGLATGVIDCIACDHAPHEADSKRKEFQESSFGIIGLQTNVPLALAQVRAKKLTLRRAIEALTVSPASCLRLEPAALRVGLAADITIIDPKRKSVFTAAQNRSKSANSPFFGWELTGAVCSTIVGGVEVYSIDAANINFGGAD
jgi:dihydroorotase